MLANYNLLKILAIFMVVAVHMLNVVNLVPPGDVRAFHVHEIIRTVLLTSNGLFFMLSGRFLLEHYDGKIGRFYWKRVVKIGIPVLAASCFYYVYVFGKNGMDGVFWKNFVKDLMQSHVQGYLWFVYALAGFYLAVPFLSRMFGQMSRREKAALTGITILYFLVQNLYQIFHLEMVFTSYFLYSWVFYCVLGYLLDSMELSKKQKNRLILAGLLCFLVSAWEICFWDRENPAIHNYSLTMISMTMAGYLAVTTYGKWLAGRLESVVHFVAGRSFWIYLMHGLTQNWIAGWLNGGWLGEGIFGGSRPWMTGGAAGWGCWFVLSVLSFVMALGIGCLLDAVYKPVSRWLLKMDFKMFAEKEK